MAGSVSATTLATIAAGAALAAAGTSAYAAVSAGQNAKEVGEYNKKVADNAALDTAQRGAIAASEQRQKTRQLISKQNVAFSSAGVDASTGSAAYIMTETAGMGELDALRLLNNAERQGAGLKAQGELQAFQGAAGARAGYFNAAGSILNGASAAAGYYGKKG